MHIYVGTNDNQLIVYEAEQQQQQDQQQPHYYYAYKEIQRIDPLIDPSIPTTEECFAVGCLPSVSAIVKHPHHPLLYVFSSFGSYHQSIVTTFKITARTTTTTQENNNNVNVNGNNYDDDDDNIGRSSSNIRLEKLYNVDGNNNNDHDVVKTGGYNVSHAIISPNHNNNVLCVVHANDGNMSFFDISNSTTPKHFQPLQQPPPLLLRTPEIRPETRTLEVPYCLPSISHATYYFHQESIIDNTTTSNDDDDIDDDGGDDHNNSNINTMMALIIADTSSQGRIWVIDVDDEGIPKLKDNNHNDSSSRRRSRSKLRDNNNIEPMILQEHKCFPIRSPLMSFRFEQSRVMPPIIPKKYTIRRVLINPNNRKYAYVLLDSHALILIYEIFVTSTGQFKLGGDCLQEIPLDIVSSRRSIHSGATEMVISNDGTELLVPNRSTKITFTGRVYETLIQRYEIQNDGARLVEKTNEQQTTSSTIDDDIDIDDCQQQDQNITISGWVKQLVLLKNSSDDTIVAGINNNNNNTNHLNNNNNYNTQQQQQEEPLTASSSNSSRSCIEIFQKRQRKKTTMNCGLYQKVNHIDVIGTNGLSCFVVVEDDDDMA